MGRSDLQRCDRHGPVQIKIAAAGCARPDSGRKEFYDESVSQFTRFWQGGGPMTLDDLRNMTQETITPAVAAQVLQCNPQWIRVAARNDKSRLGFPVVLLGSRVKIPRLAFIKFMEGETHG